VCLLFVRNDFAKVGDVLLDAGDLLWPGARALVWLAGSMLLFCFGKCNG
jgi:hypothetical protein